MSQPDNPVLQAITRSTEVLDNLRRLKGETYVARVTMFVSLTQFSAALNMPTPVVTSLLANLATSWGIDLRKESDKKYMDDLITDAESFCKQTEIR